MKYWNAINNIPYIGPIRFRKLYSYFNTMEEAWKANFKKLLQAGLDQKTALNFIASRKKIDPLQKMSELKKYKIKITTFKSQKYPSLLKEIPAPPPVIYYLGRLPKPREILIAVVGSRKFSFYGKRCAEKIAGDLALKGISIVSGMALGIDTISHEICLKNNQATFAVLGCGLDKVYPASNQKLAQNIIERGGLISEYPPGYSTLKQNFYARNRIISGLSYGVVVIEANLRSGTFITANHALDQNREVFAVPGEIFSPSSRGCHQLIKEGAKLITSIEDILEEFKIPLSNKGEKGISQIKNKEPQNKIQKKIINFLSPQPILIDKLIFLTKLETNVLLSNLTEMELDGLVKKNGEEYYLA
jgi:DNA processing protein